MQATIFAWADRFLPARSADADADADAVRRARSAIVQSLLGVVFTSLFAVLYALLGSPWSGAAILLITACLALTPLAVRRGMSLVTVGNIVVAFAWLTFGLVAYRSGGFTSPAIAWVFLLPLSTYVACGRGSSIAWSALSALLILGYFLAEIGGVPTPQDLHPTALSWLRFSGYCGVLLTLLIVLYVVEAARLQSIEAVQRTRRAEERERILSDMHDGVGGQLLGLTLQLQAGKLDEAQVVRGLESALDDLRLTMDSLDPQLDSLSLATGQIRARLGQRCEHTGVELLWEDLLPPDTKVDPSLSIHVLRFLQECATNALKHGGTKCLRVSLSLDSPRRIAVTVRDFGCGFEPGSSPSAGRGLKSLARRAKELGGELAIERACPGMIARLTFTMPRAFGRS